MDLLEDVIDVVAPTWIVEKDVRGAAGIKMCGVELDQHVREGLDVLDLRLGCDVPSRPLLDVQLSNGTHGLAKLDLVQLFDTRRVLVDHRRLDLRAPCLQARPDR